MSQATSVVAVVSFLGMSAVAISRAVARRARNDRLRLQRAQRNVNPRRAGLREWPEAPKGFEGPLRSPTRRPPINDPKTLEEFQRTVPGIRPAEPRPGKTVADRTESGSDR